MTVIDHKPGGNDIVKQATPELLNDGTPACGWDSYGQLWVRFNNHKDEPKAWTGHIVGDPRAKICPICQRGWENTAASIANQEYLHSMERLAHRTCMDGYGHLSNFNFWHDLACGGVERDRDNPSLKFEEVPNKYGSTWTGPWYKVTYAALPSHPFVVGARKRVFQLEIHGVPKELAELLEFSFKAEEVTKGLNADGYWYIHAWGRDMATKYFRTLYSMANNWQTELKRRAEPKVEA